jgi:hypothetical protein
LSENESVVFNLEVDVNGAMSAARRVEAVIYRALGLWGRIARLCGLPADSPINQIIERVQRLTMLIRIMHSAVIALTTARAVAGDPIAIAQAAIAIGTLVVSTVETVQMEMELGGT